MIAINSKQLTFPLADYRFLLIIHVCIGSRKGSLIIIVSVIPELKVLFVNHGKNYIERPKKPYIILIIGGNEKNFSLDRRIWKMA